MTQRFSQSHGIVPLEQPTLGNYIAGTTMDSINMAKYNHCTIIIMGNEDIATDATLTIYGGTADAGTDAAITFTYRYSAGVVDAASSDVLGTAATSAALTVTAASLLSAMLIIEIDAGDMYVSNTQYNFITPVLGAEGSDGEYSAVAILSEPRYAEAVMPTAVPTA